MSRAQKVVVIGGVAAGMSAAGRARRIDPELEIAVLEKGERISYGTCGLPFYISGEIDKINSLFFYTPERLRQERNISVFTRCAAVDILPSKRIVVARDLDRRRKVEIPFDKLVIATGARANLPFEVPSGADGIFALRTVDDALAINKYIETHRPGSAAIVGGGVQGLEMADALHRRGLRIRIFERAPFVATRWDDEIGALVTDHLTAAGIEVLAGEEVSAVITARDGQAEAVHAGRFAYPCQIVIVAAGVSPRSELAAKAGLRLHASGAVAVNERMETSADGIYAAGDCAVATHLVTGEPYYLPTATVAVKGGRIAGSNAAGSHAVFPGFLGTQAIDLLGWELAATGLTEREAVEARLEPVTATVSEQGSARYIGGEGKIAVRLIAGGKSGRLIGAQMFGPCGVTLRMGVLATAISARMKPEDLALLDFPYAPKVSSAWDPILIAAGELAKKL